MKILKYILYAIVLLLTLLIILCQTELGNLSSNLKSGDEQFIKIGENEIRYSQIGEGKDLLFIHGTPGSIEDWNSIYGHLSKNYRVTVYDRVGHGYSSNKNHEYDLQSSAETVKSIISKLKLKDPMVIGHSYGGSTIAHLIANHYNDDLKYMIIDSPLFDYEADLIYKVLSIPLFGKAIGFLANYTIAEGLIISGIKSSLKNQTEIEMLELIETRKTLWLQPKVLHSKAKESVNYQEDLNGISDKYIDIKSDVILVSGSEDMSTFQSQALRFSELVSTDSLVLLSNTAHYIQFDQGEEIIKLIEETMN